MKKNKQLVPRRRFKEFENDGEWEEKKLNEVAVFNPQSTLPEKFKYVDLESVKSNSLISYRLVKKINAPSRAQRLAETNDIFYQTVRPYQRNNYLFDHPSNDYVFSTGYAQLRPSINANFLLYKLQEAKFVHNVLSRCTGTSFPAIKTSDLEEIIIKIPESKKEKSKIGDFFNNIDKLISIQHKKIKKIRLLKKSYLSDMFPEEGERYPKKRFEGFREPWKSHKVSEIFTVTRGSVLAATKVVKISNESMRYPVYSSQTKSEGLMGYYDDFLYENAVTWTTDGANAGTVNYRKGRFYCTNVCGVLLSNDGYANKMVAEALNIIAWKHVSKVGNPKLMNNVMGEITIMLPIEIEEQEKVSALFQKLDNQIDIEQQRLGKLEKIRQAYLNELFV